MIIKSLEIYGYGQFVHRKIEFNREFTEILVRMKLVNQRFKLSYILYFWLSNEKEKEPRLEPVWVISMGKTYAYTR